MRNSPHVLGSCVVVMLCAALVCLTGCHHSGGSCLRERLIAVERERTARRPASPSTDRAFLPSRDPLETGSSPAGPEFTLSDARFSLASYQGAESESLPPPDQAAAAAIDRGPLPGFRQTLKRDLKRWPKELWHDTVNVYTEPVNILILLGAGGGAIALNQHGDDANARFFKREDHFSQNWRDAFSLAGSPATHFVVAGLWYTIGIKAQDDKTYEVGRKLIDALVINGVSTVAIKAVSGRHSPNGESQAFPSGHTSSTVTLAAVMHEAYGPLVGLPLYGLSALAAIERLDDREHWVSDVVFGAALGWVVGHTVASGHRPEIFGGEIAPYVNPDANIAGLAWVKSID